MVDPDPAADQPVIRLEHADLPRGLQALAARYDEDVVITVAAALPTDSKRAAVREVMCAASEPGGCGRG
jgi:hypothetical protein